jgi:alkylation response protein AidB-like acyl-CoA dehydrogenase
MGVWDDVRAFLAASFDPDLPLAEWRARLVDSGWSRPSWPADRWGRGLDAAADRVADEELAAAGAPGTPAGVGTGLAAPTLLEHGSDALQRLLLRPILTGEHTWCQLFSEPGAGSDLAGLATTATLDGDEWVVSGQKVWNTSAHHADLGLLLARTDWGVPKHAGITCFALPMRQPGVEVRPLRQMNGHASFNEVFLSEARLPASHIIGEVGGGWAVALTTLAHERRSFAGFGRRPAGSARAGRCMREFEEETAEHLRVYDWYPQRAGRLDLLPERAAGAGPVARDLVARALAAERVGRWTADRARSSAHPGPEGSLAKLRSSVNARMAADAHAMLSGADAMLTGDVVAEVLVSVPAISIAGGTDEVQRTIIGERVLGLPREPQVDRDVPYRDVRRS